MCSPTEAPLLQQEQFPNLASLGLGYNLAKGDPFAETDQVYIYRLFYHIDNDPHSTYFFRLWLLHLYL